MPAQSLPEPWLRGVTPGLDPVVEHLLRAAEQIREDLSAALTSLSTEEIWATPHGMTPAGFHAKHLAGSTDRLCTYLQGSPLNERQFHFLSEEKKPGESAAELLALVNESLTEYDTIVRTLTPAGFADIREIGRQRLPTTAISLAIHIAEHGQRHTGQAISAARLARAVRP